MLLALRFKPSRFFLKGFAFEPASEPARFET